MTTELILYGTAGCHLCEEAETLLAQTLARQSQTPGFRVKDIIEDADLLARYGTRIPVLAAAETELNWPFSQTDLLAFLHRRT